MLEIVRQNLLLQYHPNLKKSTSSISYDIEEVTSSNQGDIEEVNYARAIAKMKLKKFKVATSSISSDIEEVDFFKIIGLNQLF